MRHPDPIIHDLEIMSQSLNYRNWIFSRFSGCIGSRVVELGAGIGTFTDLLKDRDIVIPVDNYGPAVEYLKNRFKDRENVLPVKIDVSRQQLTDLKRYTPDTCICINVLEHIDDDRAALSNMFDILSPGGHLALLVPSFQFVFGTIDELVGHKRRYNRKGLSEKLNGAGFEILELYYMNLIALPGWFLNNRVLKRNEESLPQVMLFDRFIVPWIKIVEGIIHPPFGLSLIAVCEKRK
jgi:SAM-dependent methyltransferase